MSEEFLELAVASEIKLTSHVPDQGLGLAIVQAIAQHHQSYLTVKSDVGKGSLFTVHLPCISDSASSLKS